MAGVLMMNVVKEVHLEKPNQETEVRGPKIAALVALVSVLKLKNRSNAQEKMEGVIRLNRSQLGLYETDPEEWSHSKLQGWIKEAEQLVAQMQSYTDTEVIELRSLVERELNKKKIKFKI